MTTEPKAISFHKSDRGVVTLINKTWPKVISIADELIAHATLYPDGEITRLPGKLLRIKVANGHALYSLTDYDCMRATWTATLLEGTPS